MRHFTYIANRGPYPPVPNRTGNNVIIDRHNTDDKVGLIKSSFKFGLAVL